MDPFPVDCAQKFQAEHLLGEGGFGSVWLARQRSLDRPVAVKILHPHALSESAQIARFHSEAQITAALAHPHIVVVIDHGSQEGVPWIAYEYVAGDSVRARIAKGPMAWRDACVVACQVAAALEATHALGVLHRDIKPDNLLESAPGHYKVADFGIAKWTAGSGTLTEQGCILGTPTYL